MPIQSPLDKPSTPAVAFSPLHWRWARRAYALLSAVSVMGVTWFASQGSIFHVAFLTLSLGALVWLLQTLAARMARGTSMRRADELRERIEAAVKSQTVPELPHAGWASLDGLGDAIGNWGRSMERRTDQLREEVRWYRQLAEDSVGIEAYFSRGGRLLWLNPASERVTGYSLNECFEAANLIDLWVYVKDRPLMKELARRGLSGEAREDHELRVHHRDGTLRWFSCRWSVNRDAEGHTVGVRFSAQDIQRRKDVELKLLETVAALRRAQALKEHYLKRSNDEKMRLSSLLDTVEQGILFVDRDRRIVYINQPAVELWQLASREAIVGTRDSLLIERTQGMRANDDEYQRHIEEVVLSRQNSEPFDVLLNDGRIIREVSAVVPAADGSKPIGRVWVFEDVTEARYAEQRLTELAERDPLTGLYNRRRFLEEIERHLADGERRSEQVGLLSFDLDGFKPVNDTFGHQAGDEVLIRLAAEIGSIVRRNEMFFRLGGDEFAILVAHTSTERMEQLARRVLEKASGLIFNFDGTLASITVSVGVAIAPNHARSVDALIAAADRAMYQAKLQGKNRCEVATPPEQATE
ncbi:MAG: diguanylate cyclase domain protein [Rhodocyclales bacterium]|nr:diguanylate cyclase domain protein [Rhodocyclales bacterium]